MNEHLFPVDGQIPEFAYRVSLIGLTKQGHGVRPGGEGKESRKSFVSHQPSAISNHYLAGKL
jgi:hypothetical protein